MAWTIPLTWTANGVPSETDFNTHIRDNLNALKTPAFGQIFTASAGNYSTTATTAVPIDTANLSITLTTYGGNIECHCQVLMSANNGSPRLGLDYDGTAWAGTAITRGIAAGAAAAVAYTVFVTGLASGSHTFRPTFLSPVGGVTSYVMAASAPAIFLCREG